MKKENTQSIQKKTNTTVSDALTILEQYALNLFWSMLSFYSLCLHDMNVTCYAFIPSPKKASIHKFHSRSQRIRDVIERVQKDIKNCGNRRGGTTISHMISQTCI